MVFQTADHMATCFMQESNWLKIFL